MRRTVWLQETKQMRFEEAYSGWTERRLTQEDAARLLGVCARTFRRYIDRYEEEGLDGLLDKRLTRRCRTGGRRWTRCCGWWIGTDVATTVGT